MAHMKRAFEDDGAIEPPAAKRARQEVVEEDDDDLFGEEEATMEAFDQQRALEAKLEASRAPAGSVLARLEAEWARLDAAKKNPPAVDEDEEMAAGLQAAWDELDAEENQPAVVRADTLEPREVLQLDDDGLDLLAELEAAMNEPDNDQDLSEAGHGAAPAESTDDQQQPAEPAPPAPVGPRKARKATALEKLAGHAIEQTNRSVNRLLGAKKGGDLAARFSASHSAPTRPTAIKKGSESNPVDLDEGSAGHPVDLVDGDDEVPATLLPAVSSNVAPSTPPQQETAAEQLLTPPESPRHETKAKRKARLRRAHQAKKEARDAQTRQWSSMSKEDQQAQVEGSRVAAGLAADEGVTASAQDFVLSVKEEKREKKRLAMAAWRASKRT